MRMTAILLGLVVFVLDLVTKKWIEITPRLHHYPVIDGIFTVHYVQNQGIAFGLFHSFESSWKPIILSAMAILAVIIVLYYVWSTPVEERLLLLSLGLLLGGIFGNFIDRLLHGHVIDFLEFHWRSHFVWPTFNLADVAITGGVILILLETFLGRAGDKDDSADRVLAEK